MRGRGLKLLQKNKRIGKPLKTSSVWQIVATYKKGAIFVDKLAEKIDTLTKLISVKHKTPVAEQDWIYLIHHMHQPEKEADMETLHHCELFEKKSMKGKKFTQKHVKEGKVYQHVLDLKKVSDSPKVVYDHLNNGFKVKVRKINKKEYAVLSGLVSIKKTKWSDQDAGKLCVV